jgi:hypothetical protein
MPGRRRHSRPPGLAAGHRGRRVARLSARWHSGRVGDPPEGHILARRTRFRRSEVRRHPLRDRLRIVDNRCDGPVGAPLASTGTRGKSVTGATCGIGVGPEHPADRRRRCPERQAPGSRAPERCCRARKPPGVYCMYQRIRQPRRAEERSSFLRTFVMVAMSHTFLRRADPQAGAGSIPSWSRRPVGPLGACGTPSRVGPRQSALSPGLASRFARRSAQALRHRGPRRSEYPQPSTSACGSSHRRARARHYAVQPSNSSSSPR